ncbi:MAG: hypothetical protein H7Z37_10480 [Pyrinomonadaceae bacterium]|nr:hypothetical protein [Pyrinomonadaceae bacterium]
MKTKISYRSKNAENVGKPSHRQSEQGGAATKLLIVVVILFIIGHAGYIYIPTAYGAENFKQRMKEIVVRAYAMPNVPESSPEAVKAKIRQVADIEGVPSDAVIKIEKPGENGVASMRARVTFTKQISLLPFGLYKYNFQFDHKAQPDDFLSK